MTEVCVCRLPHGLPSVLLTCVSVSMCGTCARVGERQQHTLAFIRPCDPEQKRTDVWFLFLVSHMISLYILSISAFSIYYR